MVNFQITLEKDTMNIPKGQRIKQNFAPNWQCHGKNVKWQKDTKKKSTKHNIVKLKIKLSLLYETEFPGHKLTLWLINQ